MHPFHAWNCRRCGQRLRCCCEIKNRDIFPGVFVGESIYAHKNFPLCSMLIADKNMVMTSNAIPLDWFLPRSVVYHLLHLLPSLLQRVSVDLSWRRKRSALPLGRVHLCSLVQTHKLLSPYVHWQLLCCLETAHLTCINELLIGVFIIRYLLVIVLVSGQVAFNRGVPAWSGDNPLTFPEGLEIAIKFEQTE